MFFKVMVLGYTKVVKWAMKKGWRCLSGARLVIPGYEMDNMRIVLYYRTYHP